MPTIDLEEDWIKKIDPEFFEGLKADAKILFIVKNDKENIEDIKSGFMARGFKNIKILNFKNRSEEDSAVSKRDITETEHKHISEDCPDAIVFVKLKSLSEKSTKSASIKNNMLLLKKLVVVIDKERIYVQKKVFDPQIRDWIFKEQIIELKAEIPETLASTQIAV